MYLLPHNLSVQAVAHGIKIYFVKPKTHFIMRTVFIKIGFSFLLLSVLGAGCEKEENDYENIPLEYTQCPCGSEKSFIEEITMNKILLFDTTKTTLSEMKELSLVGDSSQFISYNPESNNAIFYSQNKMYSSSLGYFCNFPETAVEWEIPTDGILISFSAEAFESCKAVGSIGGWTSFTDNVLISLKKYNK